MNDVHTPPADASKTNARRDDAGDGKRALGGKLAQRPAETRRANARSQIIDAAGRLVAEAGVDALTVARIAAAVELTAAALYRYFPNKDAILVEVIAETLRALLLRQQHLRGGLGLAKAQPRALASLLLIGTCHAELAKQRPERFALLSMAIADPRNLVDNAHVAPVQDVMTRLFAELRGAFAEARACSALQDGDDDERAWVWVFALHGTLASHKVARRAIGGGRGVEADALLLPLLLGWGATPSSLQQARKMALDSWNQARPSVQQPPPPTAPP